jgi:hypothetical protein
MYQQERPKNAQWKLDARMGKSSGNTKTSGEQECHRSFVLLCTRTPQRKMQKALEAMI